MLKNTFKSFNHFPKPLLGDWIIIVVSLLLIIWLFNSLWVHEDAAKLRIRLGNQVYGEYSLKQNKALTIQGKMGTTLIEIQQGKVRFKQSPCNNQYCVHQGWLHHAGQAAICLPNQISLELIGEKKQFDTLNY
ncbi:MAG: NusG domain II-containing protein [Methylophilus sp.]|nr:NusG domain II-containing protein [Methylophilus sp.]